MRRLGADQLLALTQALQPDGPGIEGIVAWPRKPIEPRSRPPRGACCPVLTGTISRAFQWPPVFPFSRGGCTGPGREQRMAMTEISVVVNDPSFDGMKEAWLEL